MPVNALLVLVFHLYVIKDRGSATAGLVHQVSSAKGKYTSADMKLSYRATVYCSPIKYNVIAVVISVKKFAKVNINNIL